ncbi:MAG: hypothetical protein Q9162_000786 [Coniocarpon cinnabarinum]
MDYTSASAVNGPGKRGSALPRPGMTLSKLPAPSSGIAKPPVAGLSNGVNADQQPPSSVKTTALPQNPAAALSRHKKTSSQSGFSVPHKPTKSISQLPSFPVKTQARAPVQAEPGQHERQTSNTSSASSRSQYTRHNSLQSDHTADGPSGEESEATNDTPVSPSGMGTALKLPKKSRPSLSDRTIESLSNVPPSPATERRRSSFFNPQTPMNVPQRPPSSLEKSNTVSKLNFKAMRMGKGRYVAGLPTFMFVVIVSKGVKKPQGVRARQRLWISACGCIVTENIYGVNGP